MKVVIIRILLYIFIIFCKVFRAFVLAHGSYLFMCAQYQLINCFLVYYIKVVKSLAFCINFGYASVIFILYWSMTIEDIYALFPTYGACDALLYEIRWGSQLRCPYCNATQITSMLKEGRYHCNRCNTSFGTTVRTFLHRSKVDLRKWFFAIYSVLYNKKTISVRKLADLIDVNSNTAWYMIRKIRNALAQETQFVWNIADKIDVLYETAATATDN